MEKIRSLLLDELVPCPFNPRKDLGDLTELAESIRRDGIRDPLTVRPVDGRFEIVKGHRRHAAGKIAKVSFAPCIVKTLSDDEARHEQMVEAVHGQGLHWLDEAKAIEYFLQKNGGDYGAVAAIFGKKVLYIQRSARLLQLIEPAENLVRSGKVGREAAMAIASMSPDAQARCVREMNDRKDYGANIAKWLLNESANSLSVAKWKMDDAELVPEAGPCSRCPKQTGNEPVLFEQLDGARSTCLDGECFRKKQAAWVAIQKSKKPQAVVVDGAKYSYQYPRAKVPAGAPLPVDLAKIVRKGEQRCEATKPIIDVSKKSRLSAGDEICTDPKCQIHNGSRRPSEDEKTERKKERELAKENKELALRLFNHILRSADRKGLARRVASVMWDRLWSDAKRAFCVAQGIEPEQSEFGGKDFHNPVARILAGEVPFRFAGIPDIEPSGEDMLIAFSIVDLLSGANRERIREIADRFDVDLKEIERGEKSDSKTKRPKK